MSAKEKLHPGAIEHAIFQYQLTVPGARVQYGANVPLWQCYYITTAIPCH